jgi:hypothetical protein
MSRIYSDVVDTSIKTAGPEGNFFYNIYWFANGYEEHRTIRKSPKRSPATYLKASVPI